MTDNDFLSEAQDILDLKSTKTMVFSLLPYLNLLEIELGTEVLPPPEGVYLTGQVDPVLVPGKLYYHTVKDATGKEVFEPVPMVLSNVTSAIRDSNLNIVIPEFVMRRQAKLLSNQPGVFVRGIYILDILVREYLDRLAPYGKASTVTGDVNDHLGPNGSDIFGAGVIEDICDELFTQIKEFVGKNTWHIYFVKRVGSDMYIDMAVDFRVFEWTRQQYESENGDAD